MNDFCDECGAMSTRDWLKISQVSRVLDKSDRWVTDRAKDRTLVSRREGRFWRISHESLHQLIRQTPTLAPMPGRVPVILSDSVTVTPEGGGFRVAWFRVCKDGPVKREYLSQTKEDFTALMELALDDARLNRKDAEA